MFNKRIFKRIFYHRKWYQNIKEIPTYIKVIYRLNKYGYDEYAHWETFNWFIYTMKDILTYYREHHFGFPVFEEDKERYGYETDFQDYLSEKWNSKIDKMIDLLDKMDENSKYYKTDIYKRWPAKKQEEMDKAKEEFFKMFSKYFYLLWD